jgi:glycosyltransferase involved in cell wall biosynthesis
MAEAMVAGAVPVVSRVGDLQDLVRDGENGFLLELDDHAGFVERVGRLLGDDALCQRMSQAARESATSYVGLDQVSATWTRHLGWLVADASAGRR